MFVMIEKYLCDISGLIIEENYVRGLEVVLFQAQIDYCPLDIPVEYCEAKPMVLDAGAGAIYCVSLLASNH